MSSHLAGVVALGAHECRSAAAYSGCSRARRRCDSPRSLRVPRRSPPVSGRHADAIFCCEWLAACVARRYREPHASGPRAEPCRALDHGGIGRRPAKRRDPGAVEPAAERAHRAQLELARSCFEHSTRRCALLGRLAPQQREFDASSGPLQVMSFIVERRVSSARDIRGRRLTGGRAQAHRAPGGGVRHETPSARGGTLGVEDARRRDRRRIGVNESGSR